MYYLIDMCIKLTTTWFKYIFLTMFATSRDVFLSVLSIIFSVLSSIPVSRTLGVLLGYVLTVDSKPYKPRLLQA